MLVCRSVDLGFQPTQKSRRTKMTQYIQKGERIDFVNTTSNEIKYLDVIKGTDKIFIAAEDIPVGATGSVFTEGVFEIPAKKADVLAVGQKVYYTTEITKDATTTVQGEQSSTTDNLLAGYAVAAKVANSDIAVVKINA